VSRDRQDDEAPGRDRPAVRRERASAPDGERGPDVRERERDAPAPRADGLSAFLYDADGEDTDVDPETVRLESLAEKDLIWIDADTSRDDALERLAGIIPLSREALGELPLGGPFIRDMGEAFVLGVTPLPDPDDARRESRSLVCVVGRNWFVSLHDGSVGSLDRFAGHLRGDSALGRLDAPSFLAQVLEWVLNSYFDRLDEIQEAIDSIEERILVGELGEETVDRLVVLRSELGSLRRRLSPHRQVFVTLAHPSFDVISDSSAAAEYDVLAARLETALQTIDATREMVFGSFDVVMSHTAQRTNDIMRVLTIVSVALLPATVIAGVLGMNSLPEYLASPWVFWLAVVVMLLVGLLMLLAARMIFWKR
jgi:Mg2+ and Co2+ transporter CorA